MLFKRPAVLQADTGPGEDVYKRQQLVYEAIEAIDEGPVEAAVSVGANKVQVAFWSVAPQIMSQVAGYTFYALEVNVRASAVLGLSLIHI